MAYLLGLVRCMQRTLIWREPTILALGHSLSKREGGAQNCCEFVFIFSQEFLCQQSVQLSLEYFSDFVHHHLILSCEILSTKIGLALSSQLNSL